MNDESTVPQVFVFTEDDNGSELSVHTDMPELELIQFLIDKKNDYDHERRLYQMTIEQSQWLRDILNEWLGE